MDFVHEHLVALTKKVTHISTREMVAPLLYSLESSTLRLRHNLDRNTLDERTLDGTRGARRVSGLRDVHLRIHMVVPHLSGIVNRVVPRHPAD
jgi:hypothetical protein